MDKVVHIEEAGPKTASETEHQHDETIPALTKAETGCLDGDCCPVRPQRD